MINPNLALRTALYAFLNGKIKYNGTVINLFEDYVQETATKKVTLLDVGNMQVKAYVLIKNQNTVADNSSKCLRNDQSSLQLQVYASYPAGKGGSSVPEIISNSILSIITTDNLIGWKIEVDGINNISFDDTDARTWCTVINLTYSVNQ